MTELNNIFAKVDDNRRVSISERKVKTIRIFVNRFPIHRNVMFPITFAVRSASKF